MKDPRIEKLADLLVNYSVEVQPKQKVLIHGEGGGEPLMMAVFDKCLQKGAYPFILRYPYNWYDSIFRYGSPDMYEKLLEQLKQMVATYDVRIRILGEENTKELSKFNPEHVAKFYAVSGKISRIMLEREAKGEMKWVLSLFPTQAYAQDANMSLIDYEDFVYNACMPDPKHPIDYWKKVAVRQAKIIDWLKGKEKVHITAQETDLTLSIKGRPFANCACTANVPDGEIFTSPVEDSAEGHVFFSYPTLYEGFEVTGVRLWFEKGRVIKATAQKNEEFLHKKLDTDAGSRSLGEFAIGTNAGIQQFTGQILFDEKIGGSFHMALGHGYPETKSQNESVIHWDMICDLRQGGKILVDDELFYQNGRFMIDY
ncbi:MAG TPA: aminopeptidase [Anaerolineae bacterium]|nr:aminopeptidase [Anaerolineae bacterium]